MNESQPKTFWNGDPAECRRVLVRVAESDDTTQEDVHAYKRGKGGDQRNRIRPTPALFRCGFYDVTKHWLGILAGVAGWSIAIAGIGLCFFWHGNLLLRLLAGFVGIIVPGCHLLPWASERLEQ